MATAMLTLMVSGYIPKWFMNLSTKGLPLQYRPSLMCSYCWSNFVSVYHAVTTNPNYITLF